MAERRASLSDSPKRSVRERRVEDADLQCRAGDRPDHRGLPRCEPAARLQVDSELQGREGRAATWCGWAPGSSAAQLRGDLPFVRRRRPGGARHKHPRRAHRVGGTALLLGSCGLRAPLCGRGPADAFAGVERRHDRHRVDHRCLAVWMSVTFCGLGRGGLIACALRRIILPGTGVKIVSAVALFHSFGVARQGPWITWVHKGRADSPSRIRLADIIPCKLRCSANGSTTLSMWHMGGVMTANNSPSRTVGWLAIATGGVILIGDISLMLFFTIGGFFGT